MKRASPILIVLCLLTLAPAAEKAQAAGATLLELRWYGSYNPAWTPAEWDIKAEAMKRHVALTADIGVKCDYFLTPAELEYLSSNAPSLITALKSSGDTINLYEPDEPKTLSPVRLLKGKTWEEDVKAVLNFETHKVVPETGDIIPTQSGGLGLMTQVFGAQVVAARPSAHVPILAVFKQMGIQACLGPLQDFALCQRPVWFMGMPNIPDPAISDSAKWISAGVEALNSANPQSPEPQRRITLVIRDTDFLACASDAQRESLLTTYAKLLKAALSKGMRPVSIRYLLDMVVDDREKQLSQAAMDQAADYYLKACLRLTGDRLAPPPYVDLTGDVLSLADAFQVFHLALAWWKDARSFAPTARSRDILGPTAYGPSLSRQTNVKLQDVVTASVDLLNKTWTQVPNTVQVGKQEMNPAEFLYLLCRTYQRARRYPQQDLGTDQALPIAVLPAEVQNNKKLDALTKLQFWTMKPVRWK